MVRSTRSDPYSALIVALIEARRGAGLRQVDLAQRLGKPQSFVSKVKNGERRLDVVEFLVIARAIGIGVADVIAKIEPLIDEGFNL